MLNVIGNKLEITTIDYSVVVALKKLHPSAIIVEEWSRTDFATVYDITINIVD